MNLRNFLLPAGLALLLAGCVVNPGYPYRDYQYNDDYYDYLGTPSYEGYYYVRIIFIGNIPYYVDDDRLIRPIPPRLYEHFRRYPYDSLGRPPVFSRDREMRDGYPVSRIIYLDGVPYDVGNDRIARPLPERLRQHFRYAPPGQGNANGNRPQSFDRHDNGRNNEPPAQFRDEDRARMQQQPSERGQSEGGRDSSADFKGRMTLSPEPGSPLHQDQPNADGSHAATTNGRGPGQNASRSQAIDGSAKKNTDNKNADRKESRKRNKEKPDDSAQTDDGSNNDNGKKQRNGRDGDQEDSFRGNSNRRN